MYSDRDDAALPAPGFPIRKSTGQRLLNASPWLIAVVHVLHRLLMPRHPPCALTILTVINELNRPKPESSVIYPRSKQTLRAFVWPTVQFSRSDKRANRTPDGSSARAHRRAPTQRSRRAAGLSKLSSMCALARFRTGLGRHARNAHRPLDRQAHSLVKELPRKEVIQPHLPVRLPCYDFTPITSPTFDGSLPKGLGHRLRVLPAFVV
jgi:hypothetical protein